MFVYITVDTRLIKQLRNDHNAATAAGLKFISLYIEEEKANLWDSTSQLPC